MRGVSGKLVNPRLAKPLNGNIAQMGEHMPYKYGVAGSSPVVPTIQSLLYADRYKNTSHIGCVKSNLFGDVAQLGERQLCKLDVESSSLFISTNFSDSDSV